MRWWRRFKWNIRGHNKFIVSPPGVLCVWALCLFVFVFAPAAHAACADPPGLQGDILFNEDENVPQVCTNTGWVALGQLNPAAGGTACSNPPGVPGEIIYNSDIHKPQYCDGDDWVEMLGTVGGLAGPADCPNIGDECTAQGNIIFAGYHPITHDHLFIPPTDQERPTSPGSFTMQWKNATGNEDIPGRSHDDGRINQQWVVSNHTLSDFRAFQACEDLSFGGHDDWYLPSRVELYYLRSISEIIEAAGNITNFLSDNYWSSTERDNLSDAWRQGFTTGGGGQVGSSKTNNNRVRCVRR